MYNEKRRKNTVGQRTAKLGDFVGATRVGDTSSLQKGVLVAKNPDGTICIRLESGKLCVCTGIPVVVSDKELAPYTGTLRFIQKQRRILGIA